MSPRDHRLRDARMADLLNRRAHLSPAEADELRRLEQCRDGWWRRLPSQIDAARAKLARLEATADRIGLGPC